MPILNFLSSRQKRLYTTIFRTIPSGSPGLLGGVELKLTSAILHWPTDFSSFSTVPGVFTEELLYKHLRSSEFVHLY